MTDFASRISGIAMLALASLPIAALATASHAETRVRVADINVLTPQGVATFNHRAAVASRQFCSDERSLDMRAACIQGVKVELGEKLQALRTAQLDRASQSFAAR